MREDDILAELNAGALRRAIAVGALAGLGLVLGKVALDPQTTALWQGVCALGAGGAVMLAVRSWQSTAERIVLTAEGLFDGTGRALARIDEIDGIEAGAFSLKPSNGFAVRLKAKGPRTWAPGMYWRAGARLGIGGVPSGRAARFMAERLDALLKARA
jgi:hypothetical protein